MILKGVVKKKKVEILKFDEYLFGKFIRKKRKDGWNDARRKSE